MKILETIRSTPPSPQALLIAAFLALAPTAALLAQSPAEAGYTVLARGPMEKLWARLSWQTNKDGSVTTITNSSFTEMADGLEYWDGQAGAWKDSQDLIEILPGGGAAALHGRVKAYFGPDLNAPGAVTLVDSNRTFKCEPIGLFYYDEAQDKTIPLAGLRNCSAELLPPNQVVWSSVLDKVSADYLVTYTKGAIEACLVLLQRPKPPEYYGLSSNTTTLEWWSAWQAPQPNQTPAPIVPELGFVDSLLDFAGGVIMPRGRAFSTGNEPPSLPGTPAPVLRPGPDAQGYIPVAKSWNNMGASSVLVEGVCWTNIAPLLSSLPEVSQAAKPAAKERLLCLREAVGRQDQVEPGKPVRPVLLASAAGYRPRGVALDYTVVQGGTGFEFGYSGGGPPDTFYVTSTVDFSGGTLIFDQNGVIKYAPNTSIDFDGSEAVTCNGTLASPTMFTSRDDDLYGQTLPDSNHLPSQPDWVTALWDEPGGRSLTFQHMTFRWVYKGIVVQDYNPADTYNVKLCTFQFSGVGIDMEDNAQGYIQNSTVCNVTEPIDPTGGGTVYGTPDDICANNADANNDGVPDYWEYQWFGTTSVNLSADSDGDCLSNLQEYQNGLNPARFLQITSSYAAHDYVTHAGDGTTFNVSANLSCPSYQWYSSSTAIPGATGASFTPTADFDGDYIHAAVYSSFYTNTTADVPVYILDDLRWGMWQNFMAASNGAVIAYQATHTHPDGWPDVAPDIAWVTGGRSLLCNHPGYTGISLCNSFEGAPGQVPVTALTRRHGYLRGHGSGDTGIYVGPGNTWEGRKVWFCTSDNVVVEADIEAAYVRNRVNSTGTNDYTIVLFSQDLPAAITPIPYVMAEPAHLDDLHYHVCFRKCQNGNIGANVPGFLQQVILGDSGGPMVLPLPIAGQPLAFVKGEDTDPVMAQTQADMDYLSTYYGLNTNNYQLNWYRP